MRGRIHFAGLIALGAALSAGAGSAQVSVYASLRDDGVDSGTVEIRGPTLVHVYFDNGATAPTSGLECQPTSGGDEICQWAVRFETTGDLVISDVAWAGSTVEDDEPTAPGVSGRSVIWIAERPGRPGRPGRQDSFKLR